MRYGLEKTPGWFHHFRWSFVYWAVLFWTFFAFSFVSFCVLIQERHKQEGVGHCNFNFPTEESDIDGGIGVRVLQHLTDDTGDGVGKPAQQRKRWTLVVVVVALMCVASLCMLGRWSLLQKSTKSMDISNLQETEAGLMANPCSWQTYL